jgi:hypothetical protein
MKVSYINNKQVPPILLFLVMVAILGCSKQSDESVNQARVRLPFELTCEVNLSIPKGASISLASDGSRKFNPPIHPIGTISNIQCNGKAIELVSPELKEGVLTTKDFGDIEVVLSEVGYQGGGLEFRATPKQIEKMKKFLRTK